MDTRASTFASCTVTTSCSTMASKSDHLSTDLLQHVVRKNIDNGAHILSVTKLKFPLGENFNSELMRIKIIYYSPTSPGPQTLSIISKCLSDDEFMIKFAKDMKYFEREMLFYNKTLKQMCSYGILETIAPKAYYVSSQPKPTMLLEDLSDLHYKILPRALGLDQEHSFYVLDRLACFHASSVALHEEDPNALSTYNQIVFANFDVMNRLLTDGLQELMNTCGRYSDLIKHVKHLESLQNDFLEMVWTSGEAHPNFNVLNHGDLWNNNIMFRYLEREPNIENVRLLDYQMLHYCSPAIDLHFFLIVGASLKAKANMQGLLRYYFSKLTHYLDILGLSKRLPTWDDFFEDFRSRTSYGLATIVTVLAFMKADKRPDASIPNLLNSKGENGFRHHAFNNVRYVQEIRKLLQIYEDLGTFDCE